MSRVMNFNAGPATLPVAALERARDELLDVEGSGMSILEHSHRGKIYDAVHQEALALVRELMGVPDTHDILFMQGGASQQFAVVPMNLLGEGQSADYVLTGSWSKKAFAEAKNVGTARAAANAEKDGKFLHIPGADELDLDSAARYVHITTNNTISGTQYAALPDTGTVPVVADMSSDIMWRPLDLSKVGIAYAGAQKNIGPSGVALVIINKQLIDEGRTDIPAIFRYKTHADKGSLYHTPPTFGIYLLRNVLQLLKQGGGLAAQEKRNREKAGVLYAAIDANPDFYRSSIAKDSRSMMNVVFNLPTPELEAEFVASAAKEGMVGLKGHRSVGGIRASIYNASQLAWVEALAQFMKTFHASK